MEITLTKEHSEMSILQIEKHFQSEKGILYSFLLYTAIITSIFLFTFLKPMNIYKKFITWLFGISIKIRGQTWKFYNFLILEVLFFVFLLCCFSISGGEGPGHNHKRIWLLKYKWLIEAEIWMTSLIIVEVLAIYRLAGMFDKRIKIENFNSENKKYLEN